MKTKEEFEELCNRLMDEEGCQEALPEISVEAENMFYENFGMSAEEIQEKFRRDERLT